MRTSTIDDRKVYTSCLNTDRSIASQKRYVCWICLPVCVVLAIIPNAAPADIVYQISGTMSVMAGPHTEGLDNAFVSMNIQFPEGVYLSWSTFGYPYVEQRPGSASLTIAGSSVAANNDIHMFDRSDLAYFADKGVGQQGLADLSGGNLDVMLPDGGLFRYKISTIAPGASNALVGTLVELDDFVPATFHSSARFYVWAVGSGIETEYSYDATISAFQVVPEPSTSLPFVVLGCAFLLRNLPERRRRKLY